MTSEIMPTASPADFKEPLTIFNPETCSRKGLCPVTEIKHQGGDILESHSLYYELHGSGPEKVVFIMGLNSSSAAWLSQVDYFGSKPEYSVLVFDNRGVGNSGVPRGPYTTSGMAADVVTLLDYIDWKEKHEIHLVGVSLGGMIAQEVAFRIPERIVSLSLVVTKAGRRRMVELPSYIGLKNLMRTMLIKEPEEKIPYVLEMLFPKQWLDAKDPSDPEGRTYREIEIVAYKKRIAVTRPQTFLGAISQMAASMTHQVAPDRLRNISSSIPKVIIVTGDSDTLIDPNESRFLKEHMPEAEFVIKVGAAHGLTIQEKSWFNELLERTFREGRELCSETLRPRVA